MLPSERVASFLKNGNDVEMLENEIVEKSHLNVIVETIRAVQAKAEKE